MVIQTVILWLIKKSNINKNYIIELSCIVFSQKKKKIKKNVSSGGKLKDCCPGILYDKLMCGDQLYRSDTCSEFLHDGFCTPTVLFLYV